MKLVLALGLVIAATGWGSVSPELARAPLGFEANQGQFARDVWFGVRESGVQVRVTSESIRFYNASDAERPQLEMSWGRARPENTRLVEGEDLLPGTVNYLIGQDTRQWKAAIPTYRRIRIRNIAPGVDLLLYGNSSELEYDLVVAPGVDLNSINLKFKGVERLRRDAAGSLIAERSGFTVVQRPPVIYQESQTTRVPVPGRYVLRPGSQVAFHLGAYNKSRPLIIDPALAFSTAFGGSGGDSPKGIAVDSAGYIYIVGDTSSTDFPVVAAYQSVLPGKAAANSRHLFITKLDPTGSTVLFSTYLGGSGGEIARGIALDAAGNIYVAASTVSTDYPVTKGTLRPSGSRSSGARIALTKLSSDGSVLLYATVIGGSGDDQVQAIAVDAAGNCFLSGATNSSDFPITPGARDDRWKLDNLASGAKAFVMKVNPAATALVYSAVIGGTSVDSGTGVAVDASGNAYVSGTTSSADFPVTPGALQTISGISGLATKAFVLQIVPDGSSLGFATYLGGTGSEQARGIALDSAKNIYVAGVTTSPDFPGTAAGSYFKPYNGSTNAVFAAKLTAGGTSLAYSALFGGANNTVSGIAVDSAGRAAVVGGTDNGLTISNGVQAYPGSWASSGGSAGNAFAVKLNGSGSDVVFSTYLGGNAAEARAVAVDANGAVVLTGTGDNSFPATPGAFVTQNPGQLFVAKISDASPCTYMLQVFSLTVNVATQTGCKWVAVPAAPWLTIASGRSGIGSGTVQLSALPNNGVARSGQASIAGIPVNINQAAGCQITVSSSGQNFGAEGGSDQVTAFTQPGCPLPTAVSNAAWIHITSAAGVSPYAYSVDPNMSGQSRYGTITIGSQTVSVTQAATACSFSVAPAALLAIAGNADIIQVTSNYTGCVWSASAGSGLSLGPPQGRGSGTVVIDPSSVSTGGTAQTISASIAGQPVTISIPGRGMPFGIINGFSGKALNAASGLIGGAAQQADYSWQPGQQWELVPSGDGYYAIRNAVTGNVLDIVGQPAANGTPVIQSAAGATESQKWLVLTAGGVYYRFLNKSTGKALSVKDSSLLNGASIVQSDYTGADNQRFQLNVSTQIPVTANVAGASVTSSGPGCSSGTYALPATLFAQPGASCTLTIAPPPGNGFAVWNDGLTAGSRAVAANGQSLPLTAIFSQCSYTVSSNPSPIGAAGGSGTFTINSANGCAWNVTGIPAWLSVSGASGTGTGSVTFSATANDGLLRRTDLSIAGQKLTIRQAGRAYPQVWRPGNQQWYVLTNYTAIVSVQWGGWGDIPVSGDFDGDGQADFAVWRPFNGTWYVTTSGNPITYMLLTWGIEGDIPVPGDYDGDGQADFAVWRPSNGTWYVMTSGNPIMYMSRTWGIEGDVPVPGDYDGDGKTDFAVWRPSDGTWYVTTSGSPVTYMSRTWGIGGDIPVPGDYDGDGKTDFAVWRPSDGAWYVTTSGNPVTYMSRTWGIGGDIPVPGDYDGDGQTDFAVWRPSDGAWYVTTSGTPVTYISRQWGTAGDVPVVPRK